jgi:hemolysin III
MTDKSARAPLSTDRRLRPSGSEDAPRGRGLVHLAALIVAVPAACVLVWRNGAGGGVGLYAVALVCLYAASTAYHLGAWSAVARRRLRQVDYAMIPLYIAAAMTPYCLLGVPGTVAFVVLGIAWFGAAAAVLATAVRFEATRHLNALAYLPLGWLPAATLPEAVHRLNTSQLALLVSMGVLYTAGAVVLATKWPDPNPEVFGYHEVWHTMVVLASACYFVLIWSLAAARH